jgi:hypothetical protein
MSTNSSNIDKWFHYAVEFVDHCAKEGKYDDTCAEKYLRKVGVDEEQVSKCIRASFVTDENGVIIDNKILSQDRIWSNIQGVFFHPSITINNMTYRGDISGYDIFKAVCAGFNDQP